MNGDKIGLVATYPDVTVSYEEKLTDEYGLKWARSIESDWFSGDTSYYSQRFSEMEDNRAYAAGLNSENRFKQSLNETGDKSILALDYKNMSVAPKFIKLIVDHIMDLPEKISVKAVDSISNTEKEEYKKELIGKLYNRDLILEAQEVFGQQFDENDFIPESMEEIKMHMELNYKQSVEIAMTEAINFIFSINDYPEETKRRIITNIVVDGFAVTRVVADKDKGIQIPLVDPKYCIYSPSKYPDLRDLFYAGEIRQMSIYELKMKTKDKFTDKQWENIARKYAGRGLIGYNVDSRTAYSSFIGRHVHSYDNAFVDVLEFEVKIPCKRKYKKKKSEYGNSSFIPKSESYEMQKYSKGELKVHEYETVFKGSYILRSNEIIFNWEPASNVAMDAKNFQEAKLSYNFYMPDHYKMRNRSYMDYMKTPIDQMQLAHLKIQQMVSQAKPTGYKIDISSIENIDLGHGESMGYLDNIDIYDATGRLYYRSRSVEGEWQNPNPIDALPNQIQNLNELMATYNFYFDQLRNITGITPNMEGLMANRQSQATAEMSINSSMSAISDVAHAYKNVTRRNAEHITVLFQDIPNDNKIYKYYKDSIGGADMKVIESLNDRSLRSFGITVHIETDREKRMFLERDIQSSIERDELRIEDGFAIRNVADSDVRKAEEYMVFRRKQYRKEKMEEVAMNQQLQTQSNQEAAAFAQQMKEREIMLELEVYKQKTAIDMMKDQQLKMTDAGIDSKLSVQEFYQDLSLKQMEVNSKAMETANQNQMAFAKIEAQKQAQKELNLQRDALGGKQNPSVTKMSR